MNQQKNRWIDWAGIYRPGGILGLMKSLLFYYVTDKVELEFGHNKIITMDDNNKEREREKKRGRYKIRGQTTTIPAKKKFWRGAEEKKRNGESMWRLLNDAQLNLIDCIDINIEICVRTRYGLLYTRTLNLRRFGCCLTFWGDNLHRV